MSGEASVRPVAPDFSLRVFSGGHYFFFLREAEPQVTRAIIRELGGPSRELAS